MSTATQERTTTAPARSLPSIPKARPKRTNWRAVAQRNEEAAHLLHAILHAGAVDVSEDVLVAPMTRDVLARLETFELDGDADREAGDDAEQDDQTEENGDEGDYSPGIGAGRF